MGIVQNLSHKEAYLILNTAYQLLEKDGKTASICIMGRNGTLITQFIMDDVRPVTANIAYMKAKQSSITAEKTGWLRDSIVAEEYSLELFNIDKKEYVPWAGGVPVYSEDGILLGGLGICNLPEEEDEKFAVQAVEEAGFKTNR